MESNNSEKKSESFGVFFRRASFTVKLKILSVAVLALVVILGSSRAIYRIIRVIQVTQRSLASATPASPKAGEKFALAYELKDVGLSLESRSGSRVSYAQFTLVFDLPNQESKHWMELNHAKLLDAVSEVGREFHIEDFNDTSGHIKFKTRLLEVYRQKFADLAPREIVFRDWILH